MISFKTFLTESNNTDNADINEILLGWYLLGNTWKGFIDNADVRKQLNLKHKKVGDDEFNAQNERAREMAIEVDKWAPLNGYKGKVVKAWWTARPGVLAKAVDREVDSRKNPTDILVQYSDGNFLGLSAKSTKTSGDIGFKNPGLGTVEKELSINLKQIVDKAVDDLLKMYPTLSKSAKARKSEIRADELIKTNAENIGKTVLNSIRDELYNKLNGMKQDKLKDYLLDSWMDAKNEVYPPYIKITGMKNGAKIEDPLKNDKITALHKGKVILEKIGNDSVGVSVKVGPKTKRIMKMRAKYESQKLASPIKFSGDPWK